MAPFAVALVTAREEHQSYPGRLHGGMATAIYSEPRRDNDADNPVVCGPPPYTATTPFDGARIVVWARSSRAFCNAASAAAIAGWLPPGAIAALALLDFARASASWVSACTRTPAAGD